MLMYRSGCVEARLAGENNLKERMEGYRWDLICQAMGLYRLKKKKT